jgi:hypothetical protein
VVAAAGPATRKKHRVALVHVRCRAAGTHNVTGSRLCRDASWRPRYDVRLDTTASAVAVMYMADVQHRCGTWDDVSLELTTGAPTADRALPTLTPIVLPLPARPYGGRAQPGAVRAGRQQQQRQQQQRQQFSMPSQRRQKQRRAAEGDDEMDALMQESVAEAEEEEEEEEEGGAMEVPEADVVTVGQTDSFALPGEHTVAPGLTSRFTVAAVRSMASTVQRVATPGRGGSVVLLANVLNDSPYSMLAGKSVVFVDGQFQFAGDFPLLPSQGRGQLMLGVDAGVTVTRRELQAYRTTAGGLINSKTAATEHVIEIKVANKKRFAVAVLVRDQVPVSSREDIAVELAKTAPAPGRHERATGLLSWNVTVAPQSSEVIPLRYTVTVPADSN